MLYTNPCLESFLRLNPTLALVKAEDLNVSFSFGGTEAVTAYLRATNYHCLKEVAASVDTDTATVANTGEPAGEDNALRLSQFLSPMTKGDMLFKDGDTIGTLVRSCVTKWVCLPLRVPGYMEKPYNTERYFWVGVFEAASLSSLPIVLAQDFCQGPQTSKRGTSSGPFSLIGERTCVNSEKGKEVSVIGVGDRAEITWMDQLQPGIMITGKHGPHLLPLVQSLDDRADDFPRIVDLHPFSATNSREGGNNTNPWDKLQEFTSKQFQKCAGFVSSRRDLYSALDAGVCLLSFWKNSGRLPVKRDALCTVNSAWLPAVAAAEKFETVEEAISCDLLYFFDVCFGTWREIQWHSIFALRSKRILTNEAEKAGDDVGAVAGVGRNTKRRWSSNGYPGGAG